MRRASPNASTGRSGCSGLYRGLRLWAGAVAEAGSLRQEDVIAALDHAELAEGPGGPAVVVPGQHHLRMNMYIAQARGGRFEIVQDLGPIDPQERLVPTSRRRSLSVGDHSNRKDTDMILATTQVEDFDRFLEIFSTKGAEKRIEHGSKGAQVFRDPSEDDRV